MPNGAVNKAILIGRIGADPELKYTPSNTAVCNFSIATKQSWKDQSGNKQEKTTWHRVVAWKRIAEIIGEYVKKGDRIYVEGRLETRSWEDSSAQKHYMTEIITENIELLGNKPAANGESTPSEHSPPAPETDFPQPPEDDLPF
ncbi:MAG: single-stranded DNA-binding protein [Gammaproteobacteria bacterium]|nr:single-stranded DNA-binding protein [Gammaproteobacteria bacterium]